MTSSQVYSISGSKLKLRSDLFLLDLLHLGGFIVFKYDLCTESEWHSAFHPPHPLLSNHMLKILSLFMSRIMYCSLNTFYIKWHLHLCIASTAD